MADKKTETGVEDAVQAAPVQAAPERPTPPARKSISPNDMATGLGFERAIAEAQARLETAQLAQQMFVNHLRSTHQAPVSAYGLRDWTEGFVRVDATE